MKRLVISQRVDAIAGRDEVRDGLDIRFAQMFWDIGFVTLPMCSTLRDKAAHVAALAPDAIVLSGGNDIGAAVNRDETEHALLDHAAATGVPVFALCRGLQMLNVYQGGTLAKITGHVAQRHIVTGPLYPDGREVNSFHDNCILPEGLGRDLEVLAQAPDGTIEAVRHVSLPWLAVMWHPERETPHAVSDIDLMRRHLTQT